MTKKEKNAVINKGQRWFCTYLKGITESLSDEARSQLIGTAKALFRKEMRSNDQLFLEVETFCQSKKETAEFNKFFGRIFNGYVTSGAIKREYRARYSETRREDGDL